MNGQGCSHVSVCVGMLLEMDHVALQQLIFDRKMLNVAVRKAQAALNNHK